MIIREGEPMVSAISGIDLNKLQCRGLSSSRHRKIALFSTLSIWGGTGYLLVKLALLLEASGLADEAGLALASTILVHFIVTGQCVVQAIARTLVEKTPVGILYRRDKAVLSMARAQLLDLADKIAFEELQSYAKINPAVAVAAAEVIAHQNAGDLQQWLSAPQNLKAMANHVYQLALVEEAIKAGDYPRP